MKERAIPFTAEEVRATLDGRKTMFRRPIRPQPFVASANGSGLEWIGPRGARVSVDREGREAAFAEQVLRYCPYGVPGDRLWVRETWGSKQADHPLCKDGRKPQEGDDLVFRANPADDYQWGSGLPSQGSFVWRPSIHMPRWASRINLTVKARRVDWPAGVFDWVVEFERAEENDGN